MSTDQSYAFGPYKIHPKEVFYSTDHSYAMVNLRPLLPDVLVCLKREVKRFGDLTVAETGGLWLTAQKVGSQLESFHKATSLTFAIQGVVKAMKRVSKELDVIMESWVEDHKKKECHRFLLNVKTLCVHPFYKSLHLILVACSVKETLLLLSGDKNVHRHKTN